MFLKNERHLVFILVRRGIMVEHPSEINQLELQIKLELVTNH